MCSNEQLVSYLYGELAGADREAFERHLQECAACRQEATGLQRTRQHLSAWAPPEPALDFRVVRGGAREPARWRPSVPQWALAAAASVLLLAGAAALANLEVRVGDAGVVVRTGWGTVPADPSGAGAVPLPAAPAAASVPASEEAGRLAADIAALAARLDELEASQRTPQARAAAAGSAGVPVQELRRILAESESRQRAEMALQIAQIWRDFNAARTSDFVRVQQLLGPELQRQQRSIDNLLYRASLQPR